MSEPGDNIDDFEITLYEGAELVAGVLHELGMTGQQVRQKLTEQMPGDPTERTILLTANLIMEAWEAQAKPA